MLDHIQDHLAFITYILNEKVNCLKNGADPQKVSIETASTKIIRTEMLPDWFEETKESNTPSQPKSK